MADSAILARADALLTPGVNPVSGVDTGQLGTPAARGAGQFVTHSAYRQPRGPRTRRQLRRRTKRFGTVSPTGPCPAAWPTQVHEYTTTPRRSLVVLSRLPSCSPSADRAARPSARGTITGSHCNTPPVSSRRARYLCGGESVDQSRLPSRARRSVLGKPGSASARRSAETEPFAAERRWAMARAILNQTSFLAHRPVNAGELQAAAEQTLNFMTGWGAVFLRPGPQRLLTISRDELVSLIEALRAGDLSDNEGLLHRPYPTPDITTPTDNYVSSLYSDESLRSLVEKVYTNALVIYEDLVTTWFPAFAPTLGLACILPVAFSAHLVPRAGLGDMPRFRYKMEPLPADRSSAASVDLVARAEELARNWEAIVEEGRQLRQLVAALHPGTEGWAHPRSASMTLRVYGNMPATAQAYQWLWEATYSAAAT